jgi:hypothetical protein
MASGPISYPAMPDQAGSYPAWGNAPGAPPRPPQPAAPALPPPPPGAFQQWLMRTFQPGLAGNAIFGIVMGGLIAMIAGGLVSIILVSILHAIAPNLGTGSASSGNPFSGQDIMDFVLGLTSTHATFRDGMQFFFLMNGAAVHVTYTSGSSTSVYTTSAILSGLLIVPALALVLGGYIAASTDLQNRAVPGLLRGAAIAIPYVVLMLILVPQVNGTTPLPPYVQGNDTQTLSIDTTSLLLFSALWGMLFGFLGATLKLGRGRWRQMVARYLTSLPQRQIVGMAVGGCSSVGLGIALSMLVLYSMLAFSALSVPLFLHNLCFFTAGYANWQYMTAWAISQGPFHAVNLFAYSFGAPVTINNPASLGNPCFYTTGTRVTLSLFGGSPHLPPWTNAFVALPIISLFLGGRISVVYGRAQTIGQGLIQGALIAVPFTILMMLLSAFTMLSYQTVNSSTSSTSVPSTVTQSFGVAPFDLLLWALVSGAVLGGIGGAYQLSTFKVSVSKALASLAKPLIALGIPGMALFDRLSGRPRSAPHTPALRLISGAAFAVIVLLIVAGAVAVCFVALNQTITYDFNTRLRDILSVVLVAVPGLLLISAGAAALAGEKPPPLQPAPTAPLPPAPPAPPVAPVTPFPPGRTNQFPNYPGGM